MDESKNQRSILENSKNNISGYTIEIGTATFKNSLEERIQAARAASSIANKEKKQRCTKEKLFVTNNTNSYFQSISVNNTINTASNSQKKIKSYDQSSLKSKDNINCSFKSTCKGGPMQSRLEAIKANKLTNTSKPYNFKCNNALGSTKCSNHVSSQLDKNYDQSSLKSKDNISCSFKSMCKGCPMQSRLEAIKANKLTNTSKPYNFKCNNALGSTKCSNHVSSQLDKNGHQMVYKCNESNKRSISPNYPCNSTQSNTLVDQYDCSKNMPSISNNKVFSVQSRLIKAKEDLKANSKLTDQNDVSKTRIVKKQLTCSLDNVYADKNMSVLHNKIKTKRLNQKKTSIIVPTNKNTIKVINKQYASVKQNVILVNNMISSNPSETVVSKKSDDVKQRELNSFSFVSPQQRLENISKQQYSNDNSMEWEDIIEPDIIVNKVNDLRRQNYNYEPMEWIPESIMHSDNINHCLVVDTNILLTELKSIAIIIDKYFPDYGFLTIVLPWQVLQELDCLKKNDNAIGYQAREATRWLLEIFSKNHPRLKGQPITKKNKMIPDDAILNCAIIVKERVNIVNLLTDDKILSVKSEVNGIHVKNSTWLQNLVKINV